MKATIRIENTTKCLYEIMKAIFCHLGEEALGKIKTVKFSESTKFIAFYKDRMIISGGYFIITDDNLVSIVEPEVIEFLDKNQGDLEDLIKHASGNRDAIWQTLETDKTREVPE